MNKLTSLLDEASIINFKLVWKLGIRYKWMALSTPFVILLSAAFFYKAQNQIHSGSISFRYIPESKSSPVTAISALIPEHEKSLDSSEILGIVNSTNFLQTLARDVFQDKELDKMNFNYIFSSNVKSYKELTADCKTEACEISFLRKTLPDFFNVVEDNLVMNKYHVNVKSLSRFTTDKIIHYVAKNVNKYRLDTIIFQLEGQIEITKNLVAKQMAALKEAKVAQVQEEKKILQNQFEALVQKSNIFGELLSEKRVELAQGKISLKYTKSTIDRKVSSEEKSAWREYKNLEMRKEMLLIDITALEHSLGERSEQDDAVVLELKAELAKINKQMDLLEKSKSFGSLEKFQDTKIAAKDGTEFNVKVLSDQISEIEANIRQINNERNRIIASLSEKEEFLLNNKAKIDYLGLLQEKLLQIRLIKETVVSDLIFDDYLASSKRYKKYALVSVVPFATILSILFTFFLIVIRYRFDNKLMDQEEFESLFPSVPVIGELSKFD